VLTEDWPDNTITGDQIDMKGRLADVDPYHPGAMGKARNKLVEDGSYFGKIPGLDASGNSAPSRHNHQAMGEWLNSAEWSG
jgi:hypothetical protein